MPEGGNEIGQLKLEIAPDVLRRVIADGRLLELADTIAHEAAAQISSQLVEEVAKAAVEPDRLQAGVGASVAFIFDGGDFGTVPPRPKWGIGRLGGLAGGGILSRYAVSAAAQSEG